jgi:hypothetical protein
MRLSHLAIKTFILFWAACDGSLLFGQATGSIAGTVNRPDRGSHAGSQGHSYRTGYGDGALVRDK